MKRNRKKSSYYKLVSALTAGSLIAQSALANVPIRTIDASRATYGGHGSVLPHTNTSPAEPPSFGGAQPSPYNYPDRGIQIPDLIGGSPNPILGNQPTFTNPSRTEVEHNRHLDTQLENQMFEAFKEGRSFAPACIDHALKTGIESVDAFRGLDPKSIEVATDIAFGIRSFAGDHSKVEFETVTPPPLAGKHACSGGLELDACYRLLDNSLNNRHQAKYQNNFIPELHNEWVELEQEINAFDLNAMNPDTKNSNYKSAGQGPVNLSRLTPAQQDELLLTTTAEIVTAIDYQAALGNTENVERLRALLAQVNPSASEAIDCILKDYVIEDNNIGQHDIVGPLSGVVYRKFDENSLVGLTVAAAIAGVGVLVAAFMVMYDRHMERKQRELDREHSANEGKLNREHLNRLWEEEKEQRELDRQLQRELAGKTKCEGGNCENENPGEPAKEKSPQEEVIEDNVKAGEEGSVKTVDDFLGAFTSSNNSYFDNDYELAVFKSRIRLENGEDLSAMCQSVYS